MNEKQEESFLDNETEIELYGDPGIASYNAKIPLFLLITYLILPIWGIITAYYYWNGTTGILDPGYWHQLQIAANTTLPYENHNLLAKQKEETTFQVD